ncbi:Flavonoid 3',5'-hydroxylase [Vitis vinifera]|uniref:Flavonoid 3',5'-hydroxylase n=1 Tax=Vitis vinifera TaxID=29760 RepID=A0A438I863_VITVI|nr:Flavonoid 3',5'-hydroxylase [Vitis vinifera]
MQGKLPEAPIHTTEPSSCLNPGSEVNGYYIPKNTRLSVNIWAIGRDPDVWESPEEFRPERICAGTEWNSAVEYILGTLYIHLTGKCRMELRSTWTKLSACAAEGSFSFGHGDTKASPECVCSLSSNRSDQNPGLAAIWHGCS